MSIPFAREKRVRQRQSAKQSERSCKNGDTRSGERENMCVCTRECERHVSVKVGSQEITVKQVTKNYNLESQWTNAEFVLTRYFV